MYSKTIISKDLQLRAFGWTSRMRQDSYGLRLGGGVGVQRARSKRILKTKRQDRLISPSRGYTIPFTQQQRQFRRQ